MKKNDCRKQFTSIRNKFIKENPVCERCGLWATQVHHIKALIDGGTNDINNLSSLCTECHREWEVLERFIDYDTFLRTPSLVAIGGAIQLNFFGTKIYELHSAEQRANEIIRKGGDAECHV